MNVELEGLGLRVRVRVRVQVQGELQQIQDHQRPCLSLILIHIIHELGT